VIKDKSVVLLALGQIITWAGLYYVFPASLVRWEQSLGWSKADLTGAITLAIFTSAFASPLAGRFIDRGKGPLLMASSALLGGITLAMVSMVTLLWQFYLAWALIGVCLAGCLYEPCFAIVTRARGAKAKQAIILITLIAGFAGAISFPSSYSLAEAFGWRNALRIFACAVIFIGAPLLWLGASSIEQNGNGRTAGQPDQTHSRHRLLMLPIFWFLGVGFALLALVHGVALHHLLPLLFERGVASEAAVIAASFIGPMQVAGRLAMMAAEKHVSNNGIAITCFLVMGCSILMLIGASTTPALLVGFVILFGGGYGVLSIIRPVIARDILGQQNFGAKSGALAVLYLAGSASAPFLGSLIWQVGGYALVLPSLVVLAAVGLGLYLTANKLSLASRLSL